MIVTNKTSMAAMMVPLTMTPAPVPAVNAWVKPINFGTSVGPVGSQLQQAPVTSHSASPQHPQQQAGIVPVDMKLDKGDQHDSGIDVSDQANSAASSTRSSPSADNKLTISHSPTVDSSSAPVLKVFQSDRCSLVMLLIASNIVFSSHVSKVNSFAFYLCTDSVLATSAVKILKFFFF